MTPELQHLPIGAFFLDPSGRVTACNQKYLETIGESTQQNPQWIEKLHSEDLARSYKEWEMAYQQKKPAHLTCRLIKSNGNTIWTDIRINPVMEAEKFIGFSGTLIDTTNQMMFEKVLERFKKAVERTDSQIIFTDAEGVVVYANEAIEKLTGFTSGELIGTKAGKPWGGLMDKEFYDHMWLQIKQQKKPYEGELINKKKTGETYYAHVNITPVLDARGEVEFFVGIERDITYFKELDKVKTEFISLASHQLRTPLSSIKWLCELFWQGDTSGLPADQRDIVSKVQHENERLIRLVNSLLNISRIDSKKLLFTPVLTNIAEVLNKFVTDLKPKIAEKQQTVELEIPADLPQIMLDTKLVGEAFSNLLSNANKYTPKGGRLWIKTKADSKELIISVADNGIGIPAEDWHRIFEKFFRARNATTSQMDGSGLGLYFVKWVAEQHGGRVWFESAENSGTTFYLAFPLPVKN